MHRLFFSLLETSAAAVFLVPLLCCLNQYCFHSKRTTVAAILFALYLSGVYALVGLPNITYVRFDPTFNFVPFRYFFTDFSSLLNVFLFIPLGLFLPVLRSKFRHFLPTLLFGFSMSVLIELLQIFTLRATDVNDLITNTAGTVLGYALGRFLLKAFPQLILPEETKELRIIIITVLLVMFFFQPFLSSFLWDILYL